MKGIPKSEGTLPLLLKLPPSHCQAIIQLG